LHEYSAQRIAIIKPSALGDIVHALPVLTALRRRFPAAHIAWIVNRAYEPFLCGHPDLDETIPFDRGRRLSKPWQTLRAYGRFLHRLRAGRFDLVVDLQGLFRSGLMCRLSGAPRRLGMATAREGSRWFYTDLAGVSADWTTLHAVERNWRAAEAVGAGAGPIQFRVHVPVEVLAWARATLLSFPRPWLCLGPGATRPTKRWPPAHFAALARRAQQKYGGTVIFVGGTGETPLAASVAQVLDGSVLDLTGRTTLPRLAGVLSLADVMVANDTGPLHLAAALGRPTVAPYTCTRVEWHGPYGTGGAVATTVYCHGSYLRRCSRLDCMRELTPERLWPALHKVLHAWQQHHQCG
jgi:lipopolysaccharide heptosyltransferase I